MATFDEFYASLDPDVGIRGKQFEKFVKWFLKTDPTWASQIDEVWLWNDYPKRWGADCGIDLVFTHKNGKTWAVQSKCVSPNNDIKKSEIDSFLSESSDSKIDGRLLIASTDGIGKNAQQVINRQEKQVVCFLLEQFRQSEVKFPSSMDDLNQGKRKEKKKPRPHQIEAIEKVSEGIKTADRGQVLMACGTGKTLTSLWIKEKIKAEQVLVLVPSLSLLSQILKEWNAEANESFKWICVCSDQSVAKDKSEDEWISNTSEIGVPVTSETLEIKNFLDESGSKVVFSTYQSAPLIVEAQEHHDTSPFDLVIADEAHRCAGKVSSAFGCVLDDNNIQSKKRLFLTATPRILSKQLKRSASENEIEVASMDDHSVFGEVLYQIKFSEAIKDDLLSDYQVVVVGVDDQMIRDQIENRNLVEISSNELQTDAETLASHIALAKATNEYDLHRVITFHGLVKGAKNFAEEHKKVNEWMNSSEQSTKKIYAEHVSGEMSSSERNKRINRLKNLSEGERRILSNARCLSEGVDVPNLDGIAFIDPRQSQVDIIQAIGRAIRKSEKKTFGTIVIPVYLSEIYDDINDQVLASKFSGVWKIILALKSQDNSLMEEIDSLRVSLGKNKTGGVGSTGIKKVIFDLPEKVSANFAEKLKTILIQNTSENWIEMYGRLLRFTEENGHSQPPKNTLLLRWVQNQRTSYKEKRLSSERINLLESIKTWTWNRLDSRWEESIKNLREFALKNKHTFPNQKESLGKFVQNLRVKYKKNKLSQDRIKTVENIPFWIWDKLEEEWNRNFSETKSFAKKNMHTRLNRDTKLGVWISNQRASYNRNQLSKERIKSLESIESWSWNPSEDEWQNNLKKLKEFVSMNGHALPPFRTQIGTWVGGQRSSYRKNKLPAEKIDSLESIEGWSWDPIEDEWQNNLKKLKEFVLINNNFPPIKTTLGNWTGTQRYSYKNNKLPTEKIASLESIEGWSWDPYEDEWQDNLKKLKEFVLINNNFPTQRTTLGGWIGTQRQQMKTNKLSAEKIESLESIQGWSWDPYEDKWQENLKELQEFVLINGHARPVYKSSLYLWTRTQKGRYKKNKLSDERILSLEKIEGWTWIIN